MHKLAQATLASAALLAAPAGVWAQPAAATAADATPATAPPCATGAALGPAHAALPLADQIAQQLKNLPACQKNLPWLAYMGQAYNQLGRYPEAAEYLERALLLSPDDLPVQLQYALALAGSGDALAAIYLLQDLQAQPALPAPLRAAVEREVARWATAPATVAQWQHRLYLHTRLGHDSNLLGTPNLTSLTLTLPGQSLQLPLDPSYLRTAGAYTRVDTGWVASQGPWQWSASAGGRHSGSAPAAALQQLQASGEYAVHGHFVNASLGHLQSRSGTRYRTLGLVAGWQWDGATLAPPAPPAPPSAATPAPLSTATPAGVTPLAAWARIGFGNSAHACQTRLGPELQHRQIDSSPVLSGRYTGLLLQRTCQLQDAQNTQGTAHSPGTGQILQAWQISARWGVDHPTTDAPGATAAVPATQRAGGSQQQASVRVAVLGRGLAYRHQWLLDAEAFAQTDATGYSPLLQAGARRTLRRTAVRAEYSLPLPTAPQWQLAAGAEWQRQSANLALFRQQSHGAYLSLRRQW